MKTSELIKKLKAAGCRLVERKTNHDLWSSPGTGKEFLVPRHPAKEMHSGIVNSILKDAGLK